MITLPRTSVHACQECGLLAQVHLDRDERINKMEYLCNLCVDKLTKKEEANVNINAREYNQNHAYSFV